MSCTRALSPFIGYSAKNWHAPTALCFAQVQVRSAVQKVSRHVPSITIISNPPNALALIITLIRHFDDAYNDNDTRSKIVSASLTQKNTTFRLKLSAEMEVCSSSTIQTPKRSAISAHSQWPTSKVIDNKHRAGYRRGVYGTNTPRTNRRNFRKSARRPLIPVFFVISEQNPAQRMPAVAISHRGARSSPWTRTPNEDF
jgi:hypothetical protein